jgi:hypothetical protein
MSESRASENDKLIRKTPRNRSRSRRKAETDDFESPRTKPPIDSTKSSSRIIINQNLRTEERSKPKVRSLRSRSASKNRTANDNGNN